MALATIQTLVVAALTLPFAPHAARSVAALTTADRGRIVYLVVASSVVATLLQIVAQRRLSAGRVGLLFALEPVFALAFAVTIGAEHFVPRWWAGATLILAAVWWV